jgi:hypothetical protein
MTRSTISCCHATARPNKAIECFKEWKRKCSDFQLVEWIFAVDQSDEKTLHAICDFVMNFMYPNVTMVVNQGYQTCNAALNKAARVSKGDILFDVCDDVGCPDRWDDLVRECIPDPTVNVMLRVGDGQNSELCPHPILSRKRYEMLGYFMHPDFDPFHGYSDEDATLRAKKDGSMIERLDIIFEHRHPAFGKSEWDDIYKRVLKDGNSAQEILWKHHPEKRPKK